VPAPPIAFCLLSVKGSLTLDLSIAALSLVQLQSKIIHRVGELRLSIILVLREVILVMVVIVVGLRNWVGV